MVLILAISEMRESLVPKKGLVITQGNVINLFKKVNIRKVAGPDSICGRVLRYCADQLSEVFTTLFRMCIECGQIPAIWKTSSIIPVPKSNNPREMKEFRPVALTSLVMKTFEKILKDKIVYTICNLPIKLGKVWMILRF